MNTQPIAVKFVTWEVDPLDTLKDSRVYGLRLRLNNGDKMSREDKNWLAKNLHRNSYFNDAVPLMGYRDPYIPRQAIWAMVRILCA